MSSSNALIFASMLLVAIGICLTIYTMLSSAWQRVHFREFRVEHQHGLLIDCMRSVSSEIIDLQPDSPLYCVFKFDTSAQTIVYQELTEDALVNEIRQHLFTGWQKVTLFFIVLSIIFALLDVGISMCTSCFALNSVLLPVSVFLTFICSIIADAIFIISVNRIDVRFVTTVTNTYQQQIGYAFALHLLSSGCYLIAFIVSLLPAVGYIRNRDDSDGRQINGGQMENYRNKNNDSCQPLIDCYHPIGGRTITPMTIPHIHVKESSV